MSKELAEIVMKEHSDGNTEVRIRGLASDIIPMALGLLDDIAEIHANQMEIPKWVTLMALADTLKDMAKGERDEGGGLS